MKTSWDVLKYLQIIFWKHSANHHLKKKWKCVQWFLFCIFRIFYCFTSSFFYIVSFVTDHKLFKNLSSLKLNKVYENGYVYGLKTGYSPSIPIFTTCTGRDVFLIRNEARSLVFTTEHLLMHIICVSIKPTQAHESSKYFWWNRVTLLQMFFEFSI